MSLLTEVQVIELAQELKVTFQALFLIFPATLHQLYEQHHIIYCLKNNWYPAIKI